MSLEALVKEIEQSRMKEQERWMATMREQYRAIVRAKDEEIAALRDEIDTLRSWLDHSALPATNPISKRKDSTGLIKLNFGRDKPCRYARLYFSQSFIFIRHSVFMLTENHIQIHLTA